MDALKERRLDVSIPENEARNAGGHEKLKALEEVLSLDPRPSYHDDPSRVYGMSYGCLNVKFTVSGDSLEVREIRKK